MTCRFLFHAGVLVSAFLSACSRAAEWKDPSPHVAKRITVDEGVQLEVLDWGGSGSAVLLLAGGGDTAHVYDDFAPMLVAKHRVVGVTRRGHPGSSAPATGYGVGRLAEDVVRVMDAVGLKNPVVVGHSFAGEEMHVLGARYSNRIAGLVYVDAAFDRGDDADSEAYGAVARTLPGTPGPGPADLVSFMALRSFLEQTQGIVAPEAHLRARYVPKADGSVGARFVPDRSTVQAMRKEMMAGYRPYNPERILVPALSIYAVPKSVDDLLRRGSSDRPPYPKDFIARAAADPVRERVEKLFRLTRTRVENHAKWFQKFAEQGRVVELSGAHHLILSNPGEVLQHIEAFMSSLGKDTTPRNTAPAP
jgi:non-heme chloroperoxidase